MKDKIILTDPDQVPKLNTAQEKVEFWKKVEISKEFLSKLKPVPEEELPTKRKKEN